MDVGQLSNQSQGGMFSLNIENCNLMDHGVWSKNWRCQYSDWKVQTHPIVHAKKLFFYGNKPPHNRWDILRSQGPVRQKFLELTLIEYRKTLLIYVFSIGRSWGSPINNKPAVVIGISLNWIGWKHQIRENDWRVKLKFCLIPFNLQ